ncbi:uncharacterized protein BDZ99DRAFT_576541 [Mytilinidion resinicola]|uniref:DUF7924 domain-containing protein n=1 Tax=Mytilinidion resinicola TaxID=574789 RepID=A0A6A6Y2S7_9PEZI|nr:uncharacterized protein BDZ99DRAFT_576541 [Mytilinidion resinicola]KAF2802970.1 hypothetical protein BDZ99DRAFT_576541 [Mytilinidion resinicola]
MCTCNQQTSQVEDTYFVKRLGLTTGTKTKPGRQSDFASLRPTKRQHILANPRTPNYSLDKASRLSVLQTVSPIPLDHPRPPNSSREWVNPACDRIDDWLAEIPPHRASSCPPQLECSTRTQYSIQVDKPNKTEETEFWGSLGRVRSKLAATSHIDYRKTLRNNGVLFDRTGEKIPPELRSFLDSYILQERSTNLSPEAIADAVQTTVDVADSPEGNVYDLINTATLPTKRSDVGRGGNTPWTHDDAHCGYPTGQSSTWTVKENTVIDHPAARRLTQPGKGNCLPYFVLEMKSEAMGGTLWQGENQTAGSGACCVNAARWDFREAYPSEEPSIVDTIALSAYATHRDVIWHVHWYSVEDGRHYMSWIASHDTIRQVQQCNHLTLNLFDHCQGYRQTKLRRALEQLNPIPDHWKQARPASAMNSQIAGEDDEGVGSNKSQRLD